MHLLLYYTLIIEEDGLEDVSLKSSTAVRIGNVVSVFNVFITAVEYERQQVKMVIFPSI